MTLGLVEALDARLLLDRKRPLPPPRSVPLRPSMPWPRGSYQEYVQNKIDNGTIWPPMPNDWTENPDQDWFRRGMYR